VEEPQEVPADEEHERVWERVAAVDIAKASGVVCTRVPDEDRPGRRKMHVWTVQATSKAVIELGDYLRARQIQVVTLESTSDYWRIWFVILEAAGLKVQLVNARSVRNVPGRAKTDKKDAVWLAKLTEKGLLQPSFIPPYEIRRLRELTRLRTSLVHDKSRYWARLEKLLERAQIKISAVLSTLDTDTARAMIEALIAGQRNPRVLADLAIGKARAKRAELTLALDGRWEDHHSIQARILLDNIDALNRQTDQLTGTIGELISQIPAAWGVDADGSTGPHAGTGPDSPVLPAVAQLDAITGCGIIAAQAIIAESGSSGASPRRSPLRTVRARRPGTRLKQAPRALRAGVLASCVDEPGARGRRRRVSSWFGSPPVCHARLGGRGSRRRSPCGPR
jgi:transposase